jgi:hypothetical protein
MVNSNSKKTNHFNTITLDIEPSKVDSGKKDDNSKSKGGFAGFGGKLFAG